MYRPMRAAGVYPAAVFDHTGRRNLQGDNQSVIDRGLAPPIQLGHRVTYHDDGTRARRIPASPRRAADATRLAAGYLQGPKLIEAAASPPLTGEVTT
jgi:hypothetical protein